MTSQNAPSRSGVAPLRQNYHSHSFISTKVDKTQLYSRATIKRDGDMAENKVSVIDKLTNKQILKLGLLLTRPTSTCKIS